MTTILSLPEDVMFHIVTFLKISDVRRLLSVCKAMNQIISDPYVWFLLCVRTGAALPSEEFSDLNWRDTFKRFWSFSPGIGYYFDGTTLSCTEQVFACMTVLSGGLIYGVAEDGVYRLERKVGGTRFDRKRIFDLPEHPISMIFSNVNIVVALDRAGNVYQWDNSPNPRPMKVMLTGAQCITVSPQIVIALVDGKLYQWSGFAEPRGNVALYNKAIFIPTLITTRFPKPLRFVTGSSSYFGALSQDSLSVFFFYPNSPHLVQYQSSLHFRGESLLDLACTSTRTYVLTERTRQIHTFNVTDDFLPRSRPNLSGSRFIALRGGSVVWAMTEQRQLFTSMNGDDWFCIPQSASESERDTSVSLALVLSNKTTKYISTMYTASGDEDEFEEVQVAVSLYPKFIPDSEQIVRDFVKHVPLSEDLQMGEIYMISGQVLFELGLDETSLPKWQRSHVLALAWVINQTEQCAYQAEVVFRYSPAADPPTDGDDASLFAPNTLASAEVNITRHKVHPTKWPLSGAVITDTETLDKLKLFVAQYLPGTIKDGSAIGSISGRYSSRFYNRNFSQAPSPQFGQNPTGSGYLALVSAQRGINYPIPFSIEYEVAVDMTSGERYEVGVVLPHEASDFSVVSKRLVLKPGQSTSECNHVIEEFKIMSYNVWNYSPPWTRRLELISEAIRKANPDVVGIQELRNDHKKQDQSLHQMSQIASALPEYPYFAFVPAHWEMDLSTVPASVLHEGVGILSKCPLVNVSSVPLSRVADGSDSQDAHNRACLHAAVQIPNGRRVHVYGTHMSLSQRARNRNIREILEFMRNHTELYAPNDVQIFLGDLNTTPNTSEIYHILENGFVDVWSGPLPDETGVGRATFTPMYSMNQIDPSSNMMSTSSPSFRFPCREDGMTFPMDNPRKRIDFIFTKPVDASRTVVSVKDTCVMELPAIDEVFSSDHFPLIATLQISDRKQ